MRVEWAIKQRIQSSHIPPCHRHMVIATTSVQCLTFCSAVPLKRGPNVALSSPQSAAIECFLARLDRPTSPHPPLGQLDLHPRITKSDGSTAGQPGLGLEPVFCGVCVQCISGLLLGRHQYNRFPNRPLPFPSLPRRGSNCPLVHGTQIATRVEWGGGGAVASVRCCGGGAVPQGIAIRTHTQGGQVGGGGGGMHHMAHHRTHPPTHIRKLFLRRKMKFI